MSHVQNRLAATASRIASVSPAYLKSFPPKEAFAPKPSSSQSDPSVEQKPHFFDAETWASLQPPPPTSLTAFAYRIGLGKLVSSPDPILQACTHPSFLPLHQKHYPHHSRPAANERLAVLGNSLMGLFATEYVNSTYPYLPTRVMKAAVSAYVGPTTCATIAKEMGATPLLRWNRVSNTPTRPAVLHQDAMSSIPRALVALVYQHSSLLTARTFVHKFFLSREIDLRNMIKFRDPKKALLDTVAKFGRERPVSRLLRETGRLSNSPVYVVGVYSGADKLGEGFGSSLKMAEFRAAEDALLRLYLARQPPHLVQLPTSTFPNKTGSIFKAQGGGSLYVPVQLGDAEIKYGAADKTGLRSPGARSVASFEED
ncbi:hypothetical protein PHLCEN_2v8632 [Hermanssonia centrifuga]|uniref:Large ribosomal subunit protein mL44 n=1 Tax=Hermanssonia centrifuga TaxID=98765 RepID=A0A2R6NT38_9APHY|nr:hypothetical protein PHLCEN_2v8632 [Hermanssonia centrifuga]